MRDLSQLIEPLNASSMTRAYCHHAVGVCFAESCRSIYCYFKISNCYQSKKERSEQKLNDMSISLLVHSCINWTLILKNQYCWIMNLFLIFSTGWPTDQSESGSACVWDSFLSIPQQGSGWNSGTTSNLVRWRDIPKSTKKSGCDIAGNTFQVLILLWVVAHNFRLV